MRTNDFLRLAGVLEVLVGLACSSDDPATGRSPATNPDAAVDAAGADAGPTDAADGDAQGARAPDLAAIWRDHPMFRSGSRLRARVLDAGGVAVAFEGFRDAELARDCEFRFAEDGEYRCVPVSSGSIYFLDPECTQPAYRASENTAACSKTSELYAVADFKVFGVCASTPWSRVFRVGAQRGPAFAYASTTNGCTPVGMLGCLREVEPLDPAKLVRADLVAEPAGEGLAIERFNAEDGASAIHALRDLRHNEQCSVQPELRSDTCLPLRAAQIAVDVQPDARQLYSDATCSAARAVITERDTCAPPSLVVLREPTLCGTLQPKAYEIGAPLVAGFTDDGAGCRAIAVPPAQKLYEVGAELDIAMRPAVQLANGDGDRLLLRYYATTSGVPVQYDVPAFYDGQLLARCRPREAADGTTRCVPEGAVDIQASGPFADAECKQQLVSVQNPNLPNACGLVPEFAMRMEGDQLASVHALTSMSGALEHVYLQVNGECAERGTKPDATYYRVGEELELAALQAHVE